jgi:hypothetical protein
MNARCPHDTQGAPEAVFSERRGCRASPGDRLPGCRRGVALRGGCKFHTEGVQSGEFYGESLVNLYQDPDAE